MILGKYATGHQAAASSSHPSGAVGSPLAGGGATHLLSEAEGHPSWEVGGMPFRSVNSSFALLLTLPLKYFIEGRVWVTQASQLPPSTRPGGPVWYVDVIKVEGGGEVNVAGIQ